MEFLNLQVFGNSLRAYLAALAGFAGILIVFEILGRVFYARVKKPIQKWASGKFDFVQSLESTLLPLVRFGAFYFAIRPLQFPPVAEKFITGLAVVVLTVQGTRLALTFLVVAVENMLAHQKGPAASRNIVFLIKISAWGLALIFLLENLGFNVSAVVAGLGIGGVAVALATQRILGDLFNYFVVCFDKPFEIGDFIIIGNERGIVEHIGIKSTRVRSLDGEQLIISNSDLTSSRIRNYKHMGERRVIFQVGVTYQTPREKVRRVPERVRGIIEGMKDTRFDRAHFKEFGDSALIFEIVYYVLSADYNRYMDIQEEINLKIMQEFEKENIEFAYPTQTVYQYPADPKVS